MERKSGNKMKKKKHVEKSLNRFSILGKALKTCNMIYEHISKREKEYHFSATTDFTNRPKSLSFVIKL